MKKIETPQPCSGKFSLRVNPVLHRKLRDHARLENKILNEYIISLLERNMMQENYNYTQNFIITMERFM